MILDEIFKLKMRRVAEAKAVVSPETVRAAAREIRLGAESHRLRKVLAEPGVHVIAEIKRASPSKGIINDRIDVPDRAREYQTGGAAAISVLTEEDRFGGSLDDLRAARAAVALPILRKDFVFDPYQIYEAADAGADVILLIAAMLDDELMGELYRVAEDELGLDALVEVHTLEELERAAKLGAKIIGVNNRDLNTFKVSLDASRELIRHAPAEALMVSESGLSAPDEIADLHELGFRGFLIGETLMRSGSAAEELKRLTA